MRRSIGGGGGGEVEEVEVEKQGARARARARGWWVRVDRLQYLLFAELVGPALEDLEDLGTALDLTRQERDGGEGILDICQRRGGRGDKGGWFMWQKRGGCVIKEGILCDKEGWQGMVWWRGVLCCVRVWVWVCVCGGGDIHLIRSIHTQCIRVFPQERMG